VPNGDVRVVSNVTKDWSRALVDVGIAYEENLDHVLSVLEEIATTFADDPAFKPLLLEAPQVLGPVSLGDWAITVRVMVKTRPGKHWQTARELQKRILVTFGREGISMPYPRQESIVRDVESLTAGKSGV
jgi:small conductance mechanosensitive channel